MNRLLDGQGGVPFGTPVGHQRHYLSAPSPCRAEGGREPARGVYRAFPSNRQWVPLRSRAQLAGFRKWSAMHEPDGAPPVRAYRHRERPFRGSPSERSLFARPWEAMKECRARLHVGLFHLRTKRPARRQSSPIRVHRVYFASINESIINYQSGGKSNKFYSVPIPTIHNL